MSRLKRIILASLELSPPPKRRNGFPSKAAALKVPLHTGRTVNDVVFLWVAAVAACLD